MEDDMLSVAVDRIAADPSNTGAYPSSVAIGYGLDLDTGDRVRFVGDARMMFALLAALEVGDDPIAAVPSWAIIYRAPSFEVIR